MLGCNYMHGGVRLMVRLWLVLNETVTAVQADADQELLRGDSMYHPTLMTSL